MKNHARSTVWLLLACTSFATASQDLFRFAHEILFPGVTGEIRSSTSVDGQRPVNINTGFRINPPPKPQFRFPLPPLFPPPRSYSNRNQHSFFPPPQSVNQLQPQLPRKNLFTPNTKAVRPESEKQYERYLEALKAEAESATDGGTGENNNSFSSTPVYGEISSPGARSQAYVNLNIHGRDYSYSS